VFRPANEYEYGVWQPKRHHCASLATRSYCSTTVSDAELWLRTHGE